MSASRTLAVATLAATLSAATAAAGTALLIAPANGPGRVGARTAPARAGHPTLRPVDVAPSDLPAGAEIRVRTAEGPLETCTHGKGGGVTAAGVPFSGEGWICTRLPATVTR